MIRIAARFIRVFAADHVFRVRSESVALERRLIPVEAYGRCADPRPADVRDAAAHLNQVFRSHASDLLVVHSFEIDLGILRAAVDLHERRLPLLALLGELRGPPRDEATMSASTRRAGS